MCRFVVGGLLLFASATSLPGQIQTVLLTGPDQVPQLADGPFVNFSAVVLNNRGQIAFHSENDRSVGQREFIGLWSAGHFDFFEEAGFDLDEDEVRFTLNDLGHVIFRTETWDDVHGTWCWRGGDDLVTLAATGSPVPGIEGAVLKGGHAVANRVGSTLISAGVEDLDGRIRSAVLVADSESLSEVVAIEGESITSSGAQLSEFSELTYDERLFGALYNDRGQYLLRNHHDYWLGSGGLDGPREFVINDRGEAAGTDGRIRDLSDISLNNNGRVAVAGRLQQTGGVTESNDQALWSFRSGGITELVVREGQPAHDIANATYGYVGVSSLNDQDDLAYHAEFREAATTDENSGIWLDDETPRLLARTGGVAPATDDEARFGDIGRPVLNNLRQTAIWATILGGTAGDEPGQGIWIHDFDGDWSLIARTGQELEVSPGNSHTIESLWLDGLNDLGQVAFTASFQKNGEQFAGVFLSDGFPCDLDGDGLCRSNDIDRLMREIAAGTNADALDLTGDGLVSDADRDAWLARASLENGFAEPYRLGDANLDGVVNAMDLGAVGTNWTTDENGWSQGNFVGAGVNRADLNSLGLNWRSSIATVDNPQAVPEPSVAFLWWVLAGLLEFRRRRTLMGWHGVLHCGVPRRKR